MNDFDDERTLEEEEALEAEVRNFDRFCYCGGRNVKIHF